MPKGSNDQNPVMLTYVKLAVGNGGAFNEASALANTWAQFSAGDGPAHVETWDGRRLTYYTAGFNDAAIVAAELVTNRGRHYEPSPPYTFVPSTSGQCGSFASLLQSALAMNGIHSNWIVVEAEYQPTPTTSWSNMAIKNWCFVGLAGCPAGTPTYPGEPDYKYKFILNVTDLMVPARMDYGDLSNQAGIAGQNAIPFPLFPYIPTPLEKVFARHFIVQVPWLDGLPAGGNHYYDPSYGVTYPSVAGFESQAVAGYAYQFFQELGTTFWHAARPKPGSPNIRFTQVPTQSIP